MATPRKQSPKKITRRSSKRTVNKRSDRSIKKHSNSCQPVRYCCQRLTPQRQFDEGVSIDRSELIRVISTKWVNGTELRYYFFTKAGMRGTPTELDVVRAAFEKWKKVGIGLKFIETDIPDEAEVRISFKRDGSAWSYVGREVLDQAQSAPTMNFGWNIGNDIDTAIHEIGHTLGFPHEHQNPNTGIVWDEDAVYQALSGPPNFWPRDVTYWNILRKEERSEVEGSEWDKDSIMHYPFEAGLILEPEKYQTQPLTPKAGLSKRDKEWVKVFYPPLRDNDHKELKTFRSVKLNVEAGDQADFYFTPTASRKYKFSTFGKVDTVLVLFEEINGESRYVSGDDDGGYDFNALIEEKLFADRTYILRARLYWQHQKGDFSIMAW